MSTSAPTIIGLVAVFAAGLLQVAEIRITR
jgi:hypothetical protein